MKPLWHCPRCGRPFANRNQGHSCVRVRVRDHLRTATPHARRLFRAFSRAVRAIGPFRYAVSRSRIGYQVRMTFADVMFEQRGLHAYVVLARRIRHPRFVRVEHVGPGSHVYHFKIRRQEDIDGQVEDWLREAYRVGTQERPRPGAPERRRSRSTKRAS